MRLARIMAALVAPASESVQRLRPELQQSGWLTYQLLGAILASEALVLADEAEEMELDAMSADARAASEKERLDTVLALLQSLHVVFASARRTHWVAQTMFVVPSRFKSTDLPPALPPPIVALLQRSAAHGTAAVLARRLRPQGRGPLPPGLFTALQASLLPAARGLGPLTECCTLAGRDMAVLLPRRCVALLAVASDSLDDGALDTFIDVIVVSADGAEQVAAGRCRVRSPRRVLVYLAGRCSWHACHVCLHRRLPAHGGVWKRPCDRLRRPALVGPSGRPPSCARTAHVWQWRRW